MNKILFGGSFDPIHLGHINMAEQASKQLDADVIFLPSKVAVWKTDSTDITHKVNMINLAIREYPRFSVDLYEVEKDEEQNYSIDTVRYFVNKYPDDTFYYLIGTDHVNAFHKWKEADELARLAHIVFFARPDYQLDEENVKKYGMTQIEGTPQNISSTDIRSLKSLEVDEAVLDYIMLAELYFVPKIRSFITTKRYIHSCNVADLAYEIAKANNIERPDRAYIAGLLHDIGKYKENDSTIMVEHYKEYVDYPSYLKHQFIGEYLAKTEFGIVDPEILEAIAYHTTGKDNMCDLAKIIYAADKIEPGRGYDSSEYIKAMMENVEKGFLTVLKANIEFFEERQIDYKNPLTSKMIEYYLD